MTEITAQFIMISFVALGAIASLIVYIGVVAAIAFGMYNVYHSDTDPVVKILGLFSLAWLLMLVLSAFVLGLSTLI